MVKCGISNDDIVKVSRTTPQQQSLTASDEEILRNRIFIVEQAVKNRVQYNELMQFRLKSDKIDISDLSTDLINQFLNDESIERLENMIDSKVSKEELENYISRTEFDLYKKFIAESFKNINETIHEHHDECIHNYGYVKGLLENKIDDDQFALLELRVSNLERNGGSGSGGSNSGSVDLSDIKSRLTNLENEDIQINSTLLNKADRYELNNYRPNSTLINENDLSAEVIEKLNNVGNSNVDLSNYVERQELISTLNGYATEDFVVEKINEIDQTVNWEDIVNKPSIPSKSSDLTLDNVYNKTEIDARFEDISTGGDVDLSGYATVESVNSHISTLNAAIEGKANVVHTHNEYATEDFVVEKINEIDQTVNWSDIIDKPEVPSKSSDLTLDNVYNKIEIDAKLANISAGGQVDLSGYATVESVNSHVSTLETAIEGKADVVHTHSEYTTVESVNNHVSTLNDAIQKKANVVHTHSEYVTDEVVNNHVSTLNAAIEGKADVVHTHNDYATKESVNNHVSTLNAAIEGKADTEHTHSEYATVESVNNHVSTLETAIEGKADTEHTHSEYAVKTEVNQSISDLSDRIDGISVPDVSTKADLSYVNTELSKKANVDHVHDSYASKDMIDSLKELIESMKTEITDLNQRVKYLESLHVNDDNSESDPNIEWEVIYTRPKGNKLSFYLTEIPEMEGKILTLEDVYGDDYSGTNVRFKMFNCGTDIIPIEPPIEIPNDVINPKGDPACQFRNFAYDDGEQLITFYSYPVGEAVNIKMVKYRTEV